LNAEDLLEGAWLFAFTVQAALTLAEVGAVNPLLVALTVLLEAVALPTVATLEVPFFLVSHSEQPKLRSSSRRGQQDLTLHLEVDLINFDVFVEKRVFIKRCFDLGSEGEWVPHQNLLLGHEPLIIMILHIAAAIAGTVRPAERVVSKALTVKLEALGLLAVASLYPTSPLLFLFLALFLDRYCLYWQALTRLLQRGKLRLASFDLRKNLFGQDGLAHGRDVPPFGLNLA